MKQVLLFKTLLITVFLTLIGGGVNLHLQQI